MFTPMPIPSVRTATIVNPGDFRRRRKAWLMSRSMVGSYKLQVAGCGFVRVLAVVLVPKVGGGYSLNAVTGSIRVARNAGTIQAKNAARPRTPTAVKSATGSVPDTP